MCVYTFFVISAKSFYIPKVGQYRTVTVSTKKPK